MSEMEGMYFESPPDALIIFGMFHIPIIKLSIQYKISIENISHPQNNTPISGTRFARKREISDLYLKIVSII